MEHYYDPNDFNKVIYHSRDVDSDERIQTLLDDADKLIEKCDGGFDDVKEYELFLRCISEQTIVENGKRRLKTKEDGTMNSDMLQNPALAKMVLSLLTIISIKTIQATVPCSKISSRT